MTGPVCFQLTSGKLGRGLERGAQASCVVICPDILHFVRGLQANGLGDSVDSGGMNEIINVSMSVSKLGFPRSEHPQQF